MSFVITSAHIKPFETLAVENYITEVQQYHYQYLPKPFTKLTQHAHRAFIQNGIEEAQNWHLTERGPVRFFIDLLIIFGTKCYQDPCYRWITEGLQRTEESQITRTNQLYLTMTHYLTAIEGEDKQFLQQMLDRILSFETSGISFTKATLYEDIYHCLTWLAPQKMHHILPDQLAQFIVLATEKCMLHFQSQSAQIIGMMTMMMFLLGHDMDNNPLYSWIQMAEVRATHPDITETAVAAQLYGWLVEWAICWF